jgi:hypothetical protein
MVNRINQQQQSELWKGAGIGGLIGMFIGQPILGALGGLAYKLFSTEGLAESAKKVVGDFTNSEDPLGSLGSILGGKKQAAEAGGEQEEGRAQKSGGLPTWAKWGIGIAAGATALNFVQDNLFSTFLGVPGFGAGFPFMNAGFGGFNMFNMFNPNMPLPFTSLFPYY